MHYAPVFPKAGFLGRRMGVSPAFFKRLLPKNIQKIDFDPS